MYCLGKYKLSVFEKNMLIFCPSQVKNDKLDLRVPVWVNRLDYTPLSGDQPVIAVGTGHHQVSKIYFG